MGLGFSPPLGFFGKFYGTVLCYLGGGNAVRFFVLFFFFFLEFYLCDFSGFCRSTFVRFRFWKITLQSLFQTFWLANGNLGYRNLLVKQGEMLPFSSGSFFKFLLSFFPILAMVCLEMSFGITPHKLTRVTSAAAGSCFLSFLSYEKVYRSHALSPECPFLVVLLALGLLPNYVFRSDFGCRWLRWCLGNIDCWLGTFCILWVSYYVSVGVSCSGPPSGPHALSTTDETPPPPSPHPLTPVSSRFCPPWDKRR